MVTKTLSIYPYHNFSKGAKELAKGLKIHRWDRAVAPEYFNSPLQGPHTVINWGSISFPIFNQNNEIRVINPGDKVRLASDKLEFFKAVSSSVRVPEFTADLDEVTDWRKKGYEVMGRTTRGSKGSGIVFADENLEAFLISDFWVKYKKKKWEFRVHVMGSKVIDVQQKVLRKTDEDGNPVDTTQIDWRIRNLENGFIFKRYDLHVPDDVLSQAMMAVQVVGLDFGAVDVIWNETEQRAYVLEVNTAPGLEGTTITNYISAFKDLLNLNTTP